MVLDENKEKLLDGWLAARNAILRASEGQMRVTYNRESLGEGGEASAPRDTTGIKGVFIELALVFPEPLDIDFTEGEKEAVEKALKGEIVTSEE